MTEEQSSKPSLLDAASWPPRDALAERQAWDALKACLRAGETALRLRVRGETGLSLPRHQLLTRLYEAPHGMSMGGLARELGVTNANATALIGSLVREGWVARQAAPGDRRKVLVCLTELGRSVFRATAGNFESHLAELFAGLSLPELRLLTSLLDKLRGSVAEAIASEPAPPRGKSPAAPRGTGPGLGWV